MASLRTWDFFQSQSRISRELLIFAAALVLGLVVVPPLIWTVGNAALGPYANGGVLALFRDFFKGLANATPSFWVVALGPYVLILTARLLFLMAFGRHKIPQTEGTRPAAPRPEAPKREAAPRRESAQRRAEPSLGEAGASRAEPAPAPAPQRRVQPAATQTPSRQPPSAAENPQRRAQVPGAASAPSPPRAAAPKQSAPPAPRPPAPRVQGAPERRPQPPASPANGGAVEDKSTNKPTKKRIPPTIGEL